jgi:competence protein ComEC
MKNKKQFYWLGFWCVMAVSLAFYYVGPEKITKRFDPAADKLHVEVLDVGQGDAIFIETPNDYQILIDGGPDKKILTELGKVMGFWDREIDAVVLTHPHSDHVAGLVEVLRRYRINHVYLSGVIHTSNDYLTFLELIRDNNINTTEVSETFVLELDNEIDFEFLYPIKSFSGLRVKNLNNTSIVNRLVYGDTAMLLMGDLEQEGEEDLLLSGRDISAQILKAGHHGSATSSHLEFLEAVDPDLAILSCGTGNSFGHPSGRTTSRMERLGIDILRTDLDGPISLVSDGVEWIIKN